MDINCFHEEMYHDSILILPNITIVALYVQHLQFYKKWSKQIPCVLKEQTHACSNKDLSVKEAIWPPLNPSVFNIRIV